MGFIRKSILFFISFLVVLSSSSYSVRALDNPAYPQYTEAACILIADQMARFKQQPQSPSYQNAARNYSRHCLEPIPYEAKSDTSIRQTPHSQVQQASKNTPPLRVVASIDMTKPEKAWSFSGLLWLVLFLVIFLVLRAIARIFSSISNSERLGREAEQQLARHLVHALSEGYHHYHNIILKTEQGDLTEIDHLITSPYGVFVIEVKNYLGWIFGGEQHPHWVVQHFRRKHQFQNPIRQNYKHTEAVAHLLEIDSKAEPGKIHSIIAFSSRAEFKTRMPDNVMYIEQVLRYIDHICEQGRVVGDEALLRYNARLSFVADQSETLRSEHKLQLKGHELLRGVNRGRG